MIDNKKNFIENDSLMYRPFPIEKGTKLTIKREHYSTSLDPRGYIPVYEYLINNTPIMWDRETGYIHFTGIWKALGNSKSDIVKMVDSNPELGTKKIRGGFLRIQGTWIPYDYAYLLCKRTAWQIRHDLIPIFGPKFPSEALPPHHEEYGCLVLNPLTSQRNTTMRQQLKPYSKPRHNKTKKPKQRPMKSYRKKKEASPIHEPLSEEEEDDMMTLSDASLSSYEYTPSPTFRVVQTYPANNCQLPSIYPPHQHGTFDITPTLNTVLDVEHVSQDIIDTISATILLQRLSQDDGARPFKPLASSYIPSKVIVGQQEFTICWD